MESDDKVEDVTDQCRAENHSRVTRALGRNPVKRFEKSDPLEGYVNCPKCQNTIATAEKGCNIVTCTATNAHSNKFFFFCVHCGAEVPGGEVAHCSCPKRNTMEARLFILNKMEDRRNAQNRRLIVLSFDDLVREPATRDYYLMLAFPAKASAREMYTQEGGAFSQLLEGWAIKFLQISFEFTRTFMEHSGRTVMDVVDLVQALRFVFKQERLLVQIDDGEDDHSSTSSDFSIEESFASSSSDNTLMEEAKQASTFSCASCSDVYTMDSLGNVSEIITGATEKHLCEICACDCHDCGLCDDIRTMLEHDGNYFCSLQCKHTYMWNTSDPDECKELVAKLFPEQIHLDMVAVSLSGFSPDKEKISKKDGITAPVLGRQFMEVGRFDITPYDPEIMSRFYTLLKIAFDCYVANELVQDFLQND